MAGTCPIQPTGVDPRQPQRAEAVPEQGAASSLQRPFPATFPLPVVFGDLMHHSRSKLIALALTVALAAGAGTAAGAAGNDQVVRDKLRETKLLKRNGRMDIRRATAGHDGELLVHEVEMRKRVDPERGKERPLITLNVRGGGRSDPEYLVFGGALFKVRTKGDPKRIGDARLSARGRRWTYSFDPTQIKGLKRYGWAAVSSKGKIFDVAPSKRYKQHRV